MNDVVLVGLMGAGKSTVGSKIAAMTGRQFTDVDRAIVERVGKTVRQLWEEGGEAAYRTLESQVVLETLANKKSTVLAAPGGVVLDPLVRSALGNSFVVWLRADPAELADRVGRDDHRPLLAGHPREVLAKMAQERSTLYTELADMVVDTDRHDVDEVVALVLAALDALPQNA